MAEGTSAALGFVQIIDLDNVLLVAHGHNHLSHPVAFGERYRPVAKVDQDCFPASAAAGRGFQYALLSLNWFPYALPAAAVDALQQLDGLVEHSASTLQLVLAMALLGVFLAREGAGALQQVHGLFSGLHSMR